MKYIILIFLLAIVSCNDAEDDEAVQKEPQGVWARHERPGRHVPLSAAFISVITGLCPADIQFLKNYRR